MDNPLRDLKITKSLADKLDVSVEYLKVVKENNFPYSQRFAFMVSKYLNLPFMKLLKPSDQKTDILSSEIEFLSKQNYVRQSLKYVHNWDLPVDEDWFFDTIQDTNINLTFQGPLSTIALNVGNELAIRSMDDVGLEINNLSEFPVLSPLPIKNKHLISNFLIPFGDENSQGLFVDGYIANKDYLPSYVKKVIVYKDNFKPVFPNPDSTFRRTDLLDKPNKVEIELNTKKNLVSFALSRLLKPSRQSFGSHFSPNFYGFTFDGYNVRANIITTARHDSDGKIMFNQSQEKILSVDKNILTVYYYPVTLQSSGTNSQESSFRPATKALYLLDKIPGMYFGKK